MSMRRIYELMFRFIIIGDCFVGKTALMERFTENNFSDNYKTTISSMREILKDT